MTITKSIEFLNGSLVAAVTARNPSIGDTAQFARLGNVAVELGGEFTGTELNEDPEGTPVEVTFQRPDTEAFLPDFSATFVQPENTVNGVAMARVWCDEIASRVEAALLALRARATTILNTSTTV